MYKTYHKYAFRGSTNVIDDFEDFKTQILFHYKKKKTMIDENKYFKYLAKPGYISGVRLRCEEDDETSSDDELDEDEITEVEEVRSKDIDIQDYYRYFEGPTFVFDDYEDE